MWILLNCVSGCCLFVLSIFSIMIYVSLVFLSSILAHEEEYTKETIVTKIKGVYQAEPLCKVGLLQAN